MKVDFGQKLLNLDREPLLESNGTEATLKSICVNALINAMPGEEKQLGEEKLILYMFAEKVHDSKGPLEMTVEELAKLKDRIGKMYGVVVVGTAYPLLEGKNGKRD